MFDLLFGKYFNKPKKILEDGGFIERFTAPSTTLEEHVELLEKGGGVESTKPYKIVFEDTFSLSKETEVANLTDAQYESAKKIVAAGFVAVDRVINGIHWQFKIKSIEPMFADGGSIGEYLDKFKATLEAKSDEELAKELSNEWGVDENDLLFEIKHNNERENYIEERISEQKKVLKSRGEYKDGGSVERELWVVYNPDTMEIIGDKHKSYKAAEGKAKSLLDEEKYKEVGVMPYKRWSDENIFARGGRVPHHKKMKVGKVMHEFKHGTLTSHGRKVTDRKQAIAIALSEAGLSNKYEDGGMIENFRLPESDEYPVANCGIPDYNTALDRWALYYQQF